MNRYGKSAGPLLALKQSFFSENDYLLARGRHLNELYAQQPLRRNCKNCNTSLGEADFSKLGVSYALCPCCGHLNGLHEDSASFCKAVYTDDGGAGYARTYSAVDRESYLQRVRDIYRPKAAFLREAIEGLGEDAMALSYVDLGAGSGYFVTALRDIGISNAFGFEVSATQVELANHMAKEPILRQHALDETAVLARTSNADVVSLIGVLEHVRQPRDILGALRANPRLRYLFISVPTFSPCVFFEMVFPTVMNRQLSGAHTHLYTESSLKWMAEEFGMKQVAAWWFGTDVVDLFRSVAVRLNQEPATNSMGTHWATMFAPLIDELQLAIDKRHLSSEVHLLYRLRS